jgi:hypothetical protein
MRKGAAILLLALGAHASADLYGVGISDDWSERFYYSISTADAGVRLVSHFDTQESLSEIELGPDGKDYAPTAYWQFERVDPLTCQDDELFDYGDAQPVGGLAITPEGIAYASFSGALPGTGLFIYDVFTDTFMHKVKFPDDFNARALFYRSDGVMLASEAFVDGKMHSIDLDSGLVTPIGSFDPGVGEVFSFAADPVTHAVYMLAGDFDTTLALYEVDMFTFDATLVGTVPTELAIVGIGAIRCDADFNADGMLNVLDFVALQLAWQAGDVAADVNGDGVLDVLDFVAFQQLFQGGCP